MIIAIDGPAGSGKTTIARLLANKLGILYLDTGATYRVLTLRALEEGIELDNEYKLSRLAKNLNILFKNGQVFVGSRDVTEEIRDPAIDKSISMPVSFSRVRKEMVDIQRSIARGKDAVVEGRDITTVVFPNAEYKFYLDADIKERAKRRYKELAGKGKAVTIEEVENQMRSRDNADINRRFGPLKKSPDAILVDTTNLSPDLVLEVIISHIKND
ncbi:MAG: cytidylate kinase [Candidatus Omnitrophica bacterium 4484_171]|nr:MAG: cytidylate kinase [Candidatus Omnitrophica bacterium 4484_171]